MFRLAAKSTTALAMRSTQTMRPAQQLAFRAGFSAAAGGLSKDVIKSRVLEVLGGFEKVNPEKLTPSASFSGDLGLDSLDAVEVMVAVEEEFAIQIPDEEADEILTVQQAIDYIAKTPEAQ